MVQRLVRQEKEAGGNLEQENDRLSLLPQIEAGTTWEDPALMDELMFPPIADRPQGLQEMVNQAEAVLKNNPQQTFSRSEEALVSAEDLHLIDWINRIE